MNKPTHYVAVRTTLTRHVRAGISFVVGVNLVDPSDLDAKRLALIMADAHLQTTLVEAESMAGRIKLRSARVLKIAALRSTGLAMPSAATRQLPAAKEMLSRAGTGAKAAPTPEQIKTAVAKLVADKDLPEGKRPSVRDINAELGSEFVNIKAGDVDAALSL